MKTKNIDDIRKKKAVSVNSINLTKLEWALKYIPDNSVQLVITDLPYGQLEQDWDKLIDYEFLWKQWRRILKPNGTVIMTITGLFTGKSIMSAPDLFKYDCAWRKTKVSGFIFAKRKPLREHETVLVFSKGSAIHKGQSSNEMIYNPQGLIKIDGGRSYSEKQRKYMTLRGDKVEKGNNFHKQEYTNYPKSVLDFASVHNPYHVTEKPLDLWEYLIKTYSNKGDLVLDVCGGSCVTAVAAYSTGRKFIVFEMLKKYWKYGRKRLRFFKEYDRDGNKKEILEYKPIKSTFKK